MIFANINGNSRTFNTYGQLHSALFSPNATLYYVTDFKARGKDYSTRKESARAIARDFQNYENGGLTWSEYNTISGILEALG